jgi:hypothetical protein
LVHVTTSNLDIYQFEWHRGCYPTLAGSVCIASKTMAKMSTLQAVAPKSYADGERATNAKCQAPAASRAAHGALASSGNYMVGHDGFHAQPASCQVS